VLTRCLVEEALRELLKDFGLEDADRVLELKICEPAMSSGAFLNEAAGQLAAKYLELKQKQIEQTIEPGRYLDELRRAKHYIVTRNVYGVDLNPTAVELGPLSLWLGSIHRLLVKEGENGGPDV
jgi:type II restriction/modification system DNA methylase subunit YeeA